MFNSREMAPAAATEDMFVNDTTSASTVGKLKDGFHTTLDVFYALQGPGSRETTFPFHIPKREFSPSTSAILDNLNVSFGLICVY